jgi:hypothetical protein
MTTKRQVVSEFLLIFETLQKKSDRESWGSSCRSREDCKTLVSSIGRKVFGHEYWNDGKVLEWALFYTS